MAATAKRPVKAKRKKTGGRKKGTPNKTRVDIRGLAQLHGERCIEVLVEMLESQTQQVRLTAAKELLDRGYGKPAQALELTGADGADLAFTIKMV